MLASPAAEETATKVTGNYADDGALTKLVTESEALLKALARALHVHDSSAAGAALDRLRVLVLADEPHGERRTRFERIDADDEADVR